MGYGGSSSALDVAVGLRQRDALADSFVTQQQARSHSLNSASYAVEMDEAGPRETRSITSAAAFRMDSGGGSLSGSGEVGRAGGAGGAGGGRKMLGLGGWRTGAAMNNPVIGSSRRRGSGGR